jgi:hypothetical protein
MRQSAHHGSHGPFTTSHPARNLPPVVVVDNHRSHRAERTGDTVNGTGDWLPGEDEPVTLDTLLEDVRALRRTVAALTLLVRTIEDPAYQLAERDHLGPEFVELAS